MGRDPRPVADGAIYHLMARGNRRQPIFLDDDDRRMFLRDAVEGVRSVRMDLLRLLLDGQPHPSRNQNARWESARGYAAPVGPVCLAA